MGTIMDEAQIECAVSPTQIVHFCVLATCPWEELDIESVNMELRKPGGGLSLEALPHPFDSILQAGLVVDPASRHLTVDQIHNTLGIALAVSATQVCQLCHAGISTLYSSIWCNLTSIFAIFFVFYIFFNISCILIFFCF